MSSVFHWWQGIVAGAGGVVAMSMLMRMGMAVGMTTMDLPTVLGSMVRRDRAGAQPLGMMAHLVNGLAFGVIYAVIWWALGIGHFTIGSAWWVGLIFGAVHATVFAMMMPMMSAMHPRVQAAPQPALAGGPRDEVTLPRFGLGGTGFGRGTPMGVYLAHLAYGGVWAIIFAALV